VTSTTSTMEATGEGRGTRVELTKVNTMLIDQAAQRSHSWRETSGGGGGGGTCSSIV
jgi:hypothetical protein